MMPRPAPRSGNSGALNFEIVDKMNALYFKSLTLVLANGTEVWFLGVAVLRGQSRERKAIPVSGTHLAF